MLFRDRGVSFVLVIVTADMRAYEMLTRRLFGDNDGVKSYRSLIALDRVKAGPAIAIPDPAPPTGARRQRAAP